VSTDIPAAIRRAVIERDQHCRFPNGCDQPAAGCEVHHLTHKADGGKTSVQDCALFCTHHQVEIHRNGWTVVLNPDGTTTAWNKDRTKVLHSHSRNHSPPPGPG
jgi:5-methylcytosine-specific restriction endonuclease McrA